MTDKKKVMTALYLSGRCKDRLHPKSVTYLSVRKGFTKKIGQVQSS
jgi:hypothetical protein